MRMMNDERSFLKGSLVLVEGVVGVQLASGRVSQGRQHSSNGL